MKIRIWMLVISKPVSSCLIVMMWYSIGCLLFYFLVVGFFGFFFATTIFCVFWMMCGWVSSTCSLSFWKLLSNVYTGLLVDKLNSQWISGATLTLNILNSRIIGIKWGPVVHASNVDMNSNNRNRKWIEKLAYFCFGHHYNSTTA